MENLQVKTLDGKTFHSPISEIVIKTAFDAYKVYDLGAISVYSLFKMMGLDMSTSQFKRVCKQGGFSVDGIKYSFDDKVVPREGAVVKIGKLKFFRIKQGFAY